MLKHSIFEGIKNLGRSFWLSVTAIFIIAVSLISVALATSIWATVGFALRQLDSESVLYVYIKPDVDENARNNMLESLKNQRDIIKDVRYMDSAQTEQELSRNPIVGQRIETIRRVSSSTRNTLSRVDESFKIVPINSETYGKVDQFVRKAEFQGVVKEVGGGGGKEFAETLQNIYNITAIVGVILVVVFSAISTLVMVNILRIAIYSRKDEIEIMRLVGATNSYIRGPFIAEGVLYNMIASIIVLIIFIPLFLWLAPYIISFFAISINTASNDLMRNVYITLVLTNIVGIVIGGFSALLATQRYLKL
jgi:cell division transport system permease protein